MAQAKEEEDEEEEDEGRGNATGTNIDKRKADDKKEGGARRGWGVNVALPSLSHPMPSQPFSPVDTRLAWLDGHFLHRLRWCADHISHAVVLPTL